MTHQVDAARYSHRGWPTPPDSASSDALGYADCLDVMMDVLRRRQEEKRAAVFSTRKIKNIGPAGRIYPTHRRSQGSAMSDVMGLLARVAVPMALPEITEKTGLGYGTVISATSDLLAAGRIVRTARGVYQAAAQPTAAATVEADTIEAKT